MKPASAASAGCRYSTSGVATCTIRPLRSTATWCPSDSASAWSCVTSTAVAPTAASAAATLLRVSSRKAASSAENGSSSSTSAGDGASARASATRCCSPPDSSCGWRVANRAGSPTASSSAAARPRSRRKARGRPNSTFPATVRCGKQRAILRHVADPPPMRRHMQAVPRQQPAADTDAAGIGALEAAQQAQQRGLAATRRAQHGEQAAGRHLQVDAGQHRAARERLAEAFDDELGGLGLAEAHDIPATPAPYRRTSSQVDSSDSVTISAA